MARAAPAAAELPGDLVVTPREIGARPGVTTVHRPGWGMAPRAAGCHVCGRDQEGNRRVRVIEGPGIQVERDGAGEDIGTRGLTLRSTSSATSSPESSIRRHQRMSENGRTKCSPEPNGMKLRCKLRGCKAFIGWRSLLVSPA